ncbi:tyrosine-type recombinase/integrase [Streptomyces sp. NPDC056669]|uniref:tyrosine-type recombinase/integrase n=1 Tax=Streptomyces sp. NPDC056669 TaxID=3345903 RepID=UPI0036CF3333
MRDLTRLELVTEAVRAALEELAGTASHLLADLVDEEWGRRYGRPVRLGKNPTRPKTRILATGGDAVRLLEHVGEHGADRLSGPRVQALRQIMVQNYYRDGAGRLRWRTVEDGGLPPSAVAVVDALWLRISQQIVEVAYKLYGEAPKADSVRTLSLGLESADNLVGFRTKQERKRQEWGDAYVETGHVWTHENGEALHPDWISRRFTRLVELSGLPPVRLHDLRHLAATLSLLAGIDIKVVQEKLGHSSRQVTSDTYTSVLPEMMRAEAESVMAVVPRDIPFKVRTPPVIPESAWQGHIAVFFAHGAQQSGDTWAVGAQTQPDSDRLGMITLAGRGQTTPPTRP